MFQDLEVNDIIEAIYAVSKEEPKTKTPYRIWFERKLISPKAVIRQAYKKKEKSNPSPDFNTDQAQKRLLKLGFPIVEEKKLRQFFSKKELLSFKTLVDRSKYDSKDRIDINIGKFLNTVSWEKTKVWAQKLESFGWLTKGGKHWNVQSSTEGQAYRKYTWYKVYPQGYEGSSLYFTVGIHTDGSLLYKMDIHYNDPFFTDEKINLFKKREKEYRIERQYVQLSKIEEYNWDRLVTETHDFFVSELENYKLIFSELWPDKRIMRLTWNSNNWELPSGHPWKHKNQGKTNIAHENQYGYGHEEWLFNERFRIEGYQYGYVRGINNLSVETEYIDQLTLYTIRENKDRCLVGNIYNVEIIEGYEQEEDKIAALIGSYKAAMTEELKEVNADFENFKSNQLMPNIKFKWSEAELFQQPIPVSFLDGPAFNRFQAYHLKEELEANLKSEFDRKAKFDFQSGKAKNTGEYTKSTSKKDTVVKRRHGEITDDLYDFLILKGFSESSISVEKTRIEGAIVDVALEEDNGYTLYEVKTSNTALKNLRQGMGQIFEYAFLDGEIECKKLIIIGPARFNAIEKEYFNRIKKLINIDLEYWSYNSEEKKVENKFIVE